MKSNPVWVIKPTRNIIIVFNLEKTPLLCTVNERKGGGAHLVTFSGARMMMKPAFALSGSGALVGHDGGWRLQSCSGCKVACQERWWSFAGGATASTGSGGVLSCSRVVGNAHGGALDIAEVRSWKMKAHQCASRRRWSQSSRSEEWRRRTSAVNGSESVGVGRMRQRDIHFLLCFAVAGEETSSKTATSPWRQSWRVCGLGSRRWSQTKRGKIECAGGQLWWFFSLRYPRSS